MRKLLIVRHAPTDWNVTGRLNSFTDISLSAEGRKELFRLNSVVHSYKIDKIISSPLKRATETANHLAGLTKCNYTTDDRLVELNFGSFEGYSPNQIIGSELESKFMKWREESNDYTPEGTESFKSAASRALSLFDELNQQDGLILMVTHGVFARIFIAECILTLPARKYRRIRLDNAALTEIDIEDGIPRLVALNCRG